MEAVEDDHRTILFSYDGSGNLLQESFDISQVSLEYNADKTLLNTVYPSGLQTAYEYDNDGRLSALVVNEQRCSFRYKENDTIAAIHYPNGIAEFTKRQVLSGTESIVISNKWQELLGCHQYKYNEQFQLTRYYRQEADCIKQDIQIAYDAGGRVVQCMDLVSAQTATYRYDTKGNMLNANGSYLTIGSMDQLTCVDYDNNGNIRSIGDMDLEYTSTGLIKKAFGEWHYVYDALGRRIEKYNHTNKCLYQWVGNKLISEQYNAVFREYIYNATDIFPLGFIENRKLYWFHRDVRGAVCTVTDPLGDIVWSATYDAFGVASIIVDTIRQPWRLLNQYCDEETGLYYNGARYYSAVLRSYLSFNAQWHKATASHYSYAMNDPWNRVCPLGNCSYPVSMGAVIMDDLGNYGLRSYKIPGTGILFTETTFGASGFSGKINQVVPGTISAWLIDYLLKNV